MAPLNTTFGVELELICVFPENCFSFLQTNRIGGESVDAGEAVYQALGQAGVPACGWEPLDFDDFGANYVPHSRWRVETDCLWLSDAEGMHCPPGYKQEAIELSSRRFDFFRDDWRTEIRTVLRVLSQLETWGCRFLTNATTGFHVHVGNGDEAIPLRTAKNVLQLMTAFERCFDELHPFQRTAYPLDTIGCWSAPLSFFQEKNGKSKSGADVFQWLDVIEITQSYTELGQIFTLPAGEAEWIGFVEKPTYGHNAAVNFENLFADDEMDRYQENLTGTIEFRQHAGTLDYLEIVAWVLLTIQVVQYSNQASDVDMLALCAQAVNLDFGLRDILSAIGCHHDTIAHFMHDEEVDGQNCLGDMGSFVDTQVLAGLTEQNDVEQSLRSEPETVRAKLQAKSYGMNPIINVVDIPLGSIVKMFQDNCMAAVVSDPALDHENATGIARKNVFRQLSAMYQTVIVPKDMGRTLRQRTGITMSW